MRTIKFRGKRIENEEWVFGNLIYRGEDIDPLINTNPYDRNPCDVKVHSETVGQFTGLTDRNGTEVYEDDIVTFQEKYIGEDKAKTVTGNVVFYHTCFEVKIDEYEYISLSWFLTNKTLEVIGNIHDAIRESQNLLKGGQR